MSQGPLDRILHLIRSPRQSLQARLVGSFLALSLITITIVATVAYRSAKDSLAQAIYDHLASTSALKEGELTRWEAERAELLELLASRPQLRDAVEATPADTASLGQALDAISDATQGFQQVFVLSGEGGRVLAATDASHVGTFHTSDLFFLEGRARTFLQSVYGSPITGRPTLTVAVPVRGRSGQTLAVLAAYLSLDQIERIVQAETDVHESAQAYLVTENHEVLTASGFGLPEFSRGVHSAGITAALEHRDGVGLYESHEGVPVIGAHRWLPEQGLALMVEVSQDEAFGPARSLLLKILIFGFAATLFLAIGVRLIALRVVRPITAVADAAALVASGDFTTFAPERGHDEVGNLARSFNSMTARLNDLYRDLEKQIAVSATTLAALEASRSLLRSIVDNSIALIAVTDAHGRVMIANEPLRQLVGVGVGEYLGEPLERLLPPSATEDWLSARDAVTQRSEVVEHEVEWDGPDGTQTYLCAWFPLPAPEDGQSGIGMIATDLTERRRIEEERRRVEAQFRHAQKLESLGVLAGGIAHDFNNILAAVLGHADLAILTMGEDPQETTEHLEQVVAAARRAAELTNQMLAYAGKASFRVETLDLNASIREMSNLMGVSLSKKVTLRSELSSEPLPIRGDPAQISQVVMNLVTNAAQSIADEAGTVTVSTASSLSADGDASAVVRISDTGCGMDPEMLDRIFDPFYTTKDAGRGLGLAAVMGIVKSIDGSLDVESELGRGTTFRLTFPLATGAAGQSDAAIAATSVTDLDHGDETILVVDDEPAVRSFTRRALERSGFTVIEARDGIEALDVYSREHSRVDAVVLDMSMPGMGGREVFEELRQADGDLPILFTSGYDPSDAAGTLLDAPRVRFLQKPYRPLTLGRELNRLLRSAS